MLCSFRNPLFGFRETTLRRLYFRNVRAKPSATVVPTAPGEGRTPGAVEDVMTEAIVHVDPTLPLA
jgi:hypothetical protein